MNIKLIIIFLIIFLVLIITYYLYFSEKFNNPFDCGVASGDPYKDSVVLWTRVEDENITWEISKEKEFNIILKSGKVKTTKDRDWTIKVIVERLEEDTVYYYRFRCRKGISDIGRTKTLPKEKCNMAITSCANKDSGSLIAYKKISEIEDLDMVLALGDYIYADVGNKAAFTIEEYRNKYKEYKRDQYLKKLHNKLPFIPVWDDHEFINNCWKDGPGERWRERKRNAIQAWFEYQPVRDSNKIWRNFKVGNILDLYMLDTRIYAKDNPDSKNPEKELIGREQEDWIIENMKNSKSKWQVLGQQILMVNFGRHEIIKKNIENISKILSKKISLKNDLWHDYPIARERFLDRVKNTLKQDQRFIVFSGDYHNSFFNTITNSNKEFIGYEFLTTSIASQQDQLTERDKKIAEDKFKEIVEDINWLDLKYNGFIVARFDSEKMESEYYLIKDNNVKEPEYLENFKVLIE